MMCLTCGQQDVTGLAAQGGCPYCSAKTECTLCGEDIDAAAPGAIECQVQDCEERIHGECADDHATVCSHCSRGGGRLCRVHLERGFLCDGCDQWHDDDCLVSGSSDMVDTFGVLCHKCFYGDDPEREYLESFERGQEPALESERLAADVRIELARIVGTLGPTQQDGFAAVLRVIADAVETRVPRSDKVTDAGIFLPACFQVLKVLRNLDSRIEQAMLEILQEQHLHGFENKRSIEVTYIGDTGNPRQGQTTPDFVQHSLRVAIYCDGEQYHAGTAERQRDHEVADAMASAGWRVLRFTGRDILSKPQKIGGIVRRALADRTSRS
jgi:very-short-patch-repair endonuclease